MESVICHVRYLHAPNFPAELVCITQDTTGSIMNMGHDGPGVCLGDGQTESYLKDMVMTGLASAWMIARRRPI